LIKRESPHFDERPDGAKVSLLVVHNISLPPGEYGGDWIDDLFMGRLDPAAHPYFADVAGMKVSAHYLIRRDGSLIQYVDPDKRAWHAGASCWKGCERCNDFSIGVELEGTDDGAFTEAQYARLARLIAGLKTKLPLRDIAAHSDVAPGRKTDPGPRFDWPRLLAALS